MTAAEKKKYMTWAMWGGGALLLWWLLKPKEAHAMRSMSQTEYLSRFGAGEAAQAPGAPRFAQVNGGCVDLVLDQDVNAGWCQLQEGAPVTDRFFYPSGPREV